MNRAWPAQFLFLLGTAVMGAPLFAQADTLTAATNSFPRYSVKVWQIDEGLPQNSVWAITQTKDGYLWVGTQQGLARFDGVRFLPLDSQAAPELKHGFITALTTSRDGSLWVACAGTGLLHMKDGAFSRFTENDGLPTNHLNCLLEAADGTLWFGSELGLTRFKDGRFSTFTDKNGLANNSVRGLYESRQGIIRAATVRGLSSLDNNGVFNTINFQLGTTANALKSVCEDRLGNIWVAANEGVSCAEPAGNTSYGLGQGLPNRTATVVFEDHDGHVWAGTYSGLAGLANGKVVAKPMNDAGYPDLVRTIYQDREQNLWIGAEDGLYRLEPARFRSYTTADGLTFDNVMSVYEDESGALWISTWGGGVNLLKDGKITPVGTLSHDKGLSIHKSRDGTVWLGMDHGGGLNRLRDGQKPARQSGLIDAAPRVVCDDRHGALWVGTSRGLNVLKDGKVEAHTTAEGLPGNSVFAILEDSAGNVWVGTDGGLMRWSNGKFETFTTRQGLSHNFINSLYEDGDHALWVGTRGGGLNRLKGEKFSAYTTRQGLFNDEIYEVLEDDFGNFWMSCRSGIFRVRKQDFDDLDRGIIKTLSCFAFGKADGLASIQCNGVAKPAGWKGKNGRLWFPTIRGVVEANSGLRNETPPPVVIEEVKLDRKAVDEKVWRNADANKLKTLRVPPGRGELEITYTALSLQAPEKNRFKYMLEPLDPDWVDAGTRREAVYNNLGPGSYRFRIQACNNDGVWNEAAAPLPLVFLPHVWQTLWFKAAIPVAAGLLFWGWYQARVSRLKAIERLRVQIAADLHDDVGSRLTKVAMLTELVERQTPDQHENKPQIQKIAGTTREVIQAMDEIVWTINPNNDTLDNLANYIFQYTQEYFQNTGVRCRFHLPVRLPDLPLSTEERHNLFMAFKEALNNILKHAEATEVRVELAIEGEKLQISIVDNGCGFIQNGSPTSGNGLNNMKRRLGRIGGRLKLESQPGSGTKIEMEAPLA
jgi:ligand-binding sensor domain-containing protein/signal transduction histidine kinase